MKEYFIERFTNSSKLAVLNNGEIDEIIIEDKNEQISVKNIYAGKITKIVKSMNACFVDLGKSNIAYLKLPKDFSLQENDRVMVQVIKTAKEPKKPSLSLEISLSGRYLVYIANNDRLVFSNKIDSAKERQRLADIFDKISSDNKSFLFRTSSMGASENQLLEDKNILIKRYNTILNKFESTNTLGLLYSESNSVDKYIMDHFDENVQRIVYSDCKDNEIIRNIVKTIGRSYLCRLEKVANLDIFHDYGVDSKMRKFLNRVIDLKSGASIVVDFTEAMTVIDVNSGKFIGHSTYFDTVFKVNKYCAREIARQIIVRNLYGIILIDFIDMKSDKERDELQDFMENELAKSSIKFNIHGFTKLGLMEISRRREGNSLHSYYFNGEKIGRQPIENSVNYLLDNIERQVLTYLSHRSFEDIVYVELYKDSYEYLLEKHREKIEELEDKYRVKIELMK